MNQLDHVVIVAPDLDGACSEFEAATGTAPRLGGAHVGVGTRNALVSFGADQYLEILAPDPDQGLDGTRGAALARLAGPELARYALRSDNLDAVAEGVRRCGLEPVDMRRMARDTPAGDHLEWALLNVGGHDLGGVVPFYIDWLDCVHPATTSPVVGELIRFTVTLPAGSPAIEMMDSPDGVEVATGAPRLRIEFDSANGPVVFESGAAAGSF